MDILNNLLAKTKPIFWKRGRLETFKNWPFQSEDNLCNPEQMAAAGFYCIRTEDEPDLVECFICSKQLDGWDPDDDPWSKHKKHQPSCAFVKINKQEETLWNLDDLYNLLQEIFIKEMEQEKTTGIWKFKEHLDTLVNQIPSLCKALRRSSTHDA